MVDWLMAEELGPGWRSGLLTATLKEHFRSSASPQSEQSCWLGFTGPELAWKLITTLGGGFSLLVNPGAD